MKLLVALILVCSTGAFALPTEVLKIARGEGEQCFMKAFMATEPTDEQKMQAHKIHMAVQKVFEDNKENMQKAAGTYMEAMMAHPIVQATAVESLHNLVKAVHPVQAAYFTGSITVINLLSMDQRNLFNQAMHDCMHE